MEIAFINLTYHKKSRSSDWFIKEIKKEFSVADFTYDVDPSCVLDILDYAPDLVICWQVDFLVPWFVSRKVKAISVPMADACENMPDEYFKLSGILGSISMTSFVYDKMRKVNNNSSFVMYAPKPSFDIDKKRGIFAFLGLRKTEYKFPMKVVGRLKEKQLRCHVHNSVDQYLPTNKYFQFDSEYFENKEDLNSILKDSNFYICPRETEGIGLSYIQAMELGCIPIGLDSHGMHDYINGGVSGVLFKDVDIKDLRSGVDTEVYFSNFVDNLVNIDIRDMRRTMHGEMLVRHSSMRKNMTSVVAQLKNIIALDKSVVNQASRRSLIGLFVSHKRILDGRYVKLMSYFSTALTKFNKQFNSFLSR